MTDALQLLSGAALSVCRQRKHSSIADWMRAQKMRIPAEMNSAMAGRLYDPDQTPAAAKLIYGFLEAAGADVPNVLVVMKDSQSAFSTTLASSVPWLVEHRPGSMAYWTDTGANVYDAVDQKFRPFFDACEITRSAMEERDAQQRILTKKFPGMVCSFLGAGSPSSFKQRTLAYCFLDE